MRAFYQAVLMTFILVQTALAADAVNKATEFDYYVLVLSWSPDFCVTNRNSNKEPQCDVGKKYGLVLHGLWPQYEQGYPQSCTQEKIPANLTTKCKIFPSDKLCHHEWEKHGTCAGLGVAGYLDFSQQLKDNVKIPKMYQTPEQAFRTSVEILKSAFVEVNKGFSEDSLAPYCSDSGRFLKEIFFCYDKKGKSRQCSREVLNRSAKSCAQSDGFVVRSLR